MFILRGLSAAAVLSFLPFWTVIVPKTCRCLEMTKLFTPQERTSLSQLRKAAGSKSLENLKDAVQGWTREELATAGQDSKTPLHMAAWKGCLENVKFLLKDMECDIDIYSKGEFSYGKTAIFFAATQSRVDVMEYLLSYSPKVTIVNNKGQSVYSIASSHDMPSSILERIQQLEQEQQADHDAVGEVWWNFRVTHSDGLEYGDLDPRFLDRPLTPEDVVTARAVNPTTKETRKGGFARKNPEVAKEGQHKQHQQQKRRESRRQDVTEHSGMTPQDVLEWECIWKDLSLCLAEEASQPPNVTVDYMLRIVALGNRHRCPWIQNVVEKLIHQMNADGAAVSMLLMRSQEVSTDERTIALLGKIRARVTGEVIENHRSCRKESQQTPSKCDNSICIESGTWQRVLMQVEHLSIRELEHNNRVSDTNLNILTLPHPPLFVDSIASLGELKSQLFTRYSTADPDRPALVAVDTEWYEEEEEDISDTQRVLSTIQIAFCGKGHTIIQTYVVDLTIQQSDYYHSAQELVRWLLQSKNLLIIGFAMLHDV
jgi:hypothetical protein